MSFPVKDWQDFRTGATPLTADAVEDIERRLSDYTDEQVGFVGSLIGALVYKGAIDASTNPTYPAASQGHVYYISVGGRIGGGSGPKVEPGDLLICRVDSPVGMQAGVGANWDVVQANIDPSALQALAAKDAADGYAGLDSSGKLKLAEVPDTVPHKGVVDSVTAMGLALPVADGDNGFIVKSPGASWDTTGVYGQGQAFMLLREDYAGAPNGGANIYPDKAVLFRVEGSNGGLGTGGGGHFAVGLRQRPGFTATQNVWIQNFLDCVPLVINGWSTQTHDLLLIGNYSGQTIFNIASSGQAGLYSPDNATSSGFALGRNHVNEVQLLELGTDLAGPTLIPGAAGDFAFHLNSAAKGFQFSTGPIGSAVALASFSQAGIFFGKAMSMTGFKIGDLANGTAAADAVNRAQLDAVLAAAQPLDATLTAFGGLAIVADKLPYGTGADTFALADFTAAARALLDDASSTVMRATLGLVIGTDVEAHDATLTAIAGLTIAADKLIYGTGTDTVALADFTATARTLLDDTSISAMRTTLGLGALAVKSTVDEADMTTGASGLAKGSFSAYRHAALTIAAAGTAMACDTEDFDVSNWFDTSNGRYTPQVAGYYRISMVGGVAALAQSKQIYCALYKNGVLLKIGQLTPGGNAASQNVSVTGTWVVQANGSTDYFEVFLLHTDTSSRAAQIDTSNNFSGHLIGRS